MKWFLFFMSLVALWSCNIHKEEENKQLHPSEDPVVQKEKITDDIYRLPIDSENDTGYFKVGNVEKISALEYTDTTSFYNFFDRNLVKKNISLLDSETLFHSVFIDHKKQQRIDTLKNTKTTIISVYQFGKRESQTITINGVPVRKYKWNGVDTLQEDIFDLYENSFRSFAFKGTEFYYINAGIMGCSGGSACLIEYQLLYDIKRRSLNVFSNFRVDAPYLFGDIDQDDNLDFLEIDNDGGYGISDTNHFAMKLYSNTKSGNFQPLRDNKGKEYYIHGNTGNDRYVRGSMNIDEFYWPVKIK